MKVYQVLNEDGNPASNDFDDICAFPSLEKAQAFLRYVQEQASSAKLTIVEKELI